MLSRVLNWYIYKQWFTSLCVIRILNDSEELLFLDEIVSSASHNDVFGQFPSSVAANSRGNHKPTPHCHICILTELHLHSSAP